MHSSRPVIMDKDFSGTAVWWVSSLNGSMQRLWPLCAKNIWYWKRWLFTFYYYACVSRNNKSMFTKSFLVESIQYYKSLESKYKWTRLRYHIIQCCYCILTTKIEKSNIEFTNMFCFHRWSLYIFKSPFKVHFRPTRRRKTSSSIRWTVANGAIWQYKKKTKHPIMNTSVWRKNSIQSRCLLNKSTFTWWKQLQT